MYGHGPSYRPYEHPVFKVILCSEHLGQPEKVASAVVAARMKESREKAAVAEQSAAEVASGAKKNKEAAAEAAAEAARIAAGLRAAALARAAAREAARKK